MAALHRRSDSEAGGSGVKVGRNDPCPCGSGKKYKQCCLAASRAVDSSGDLAWRRARRVLEGFPPRMMRFISDAYGEDALDEAWQTFLARDDGFDPESPHIEAFTGWLFHCWSPDPLETSVVDESLHDVVPSTAYLERNGRHVDPALWRYLESCVDEPFSFYEVLRCDAGRGLRLRDVLTADEHEVLERAASESLRADDIVYAQLARFDGVVMLESCASVVIPPVCKVQIVKFRTKIMEGSAVSGKALLREWDYELRDLYVELVESLVAGKPPALQNTDGDDFSPQRLVFDIDSAQAAFDALSHLAIDTPREELLAGAERDTGGSLLSTRFTWTEAGNPRNVAWGNTVLGDIEIDGKRLSVRVKSAERAARFRDIVAAALGDAARYRATEHQSIERMMAEAAERGDGGAGLDEESAALQELPEVKARIAEMMARHYESWVGEPLPALDGRTPLEAVRTPDGREMVEALVRQLERGGGTAGAGVDASVIARLRSRLGLLRE